MSDIPLHQSLGKRTIKKQRRRERQQFTLTEVRKILMLLLLMVISVTQLSLYGAVADMIAELPVGQRAPGKHAASGPLDKQEILTQPHLAEVQANEVRQGNLLQDYEQRFERFSVDQKLARLCSEAGLRLVEIGQLFHALPSPRGKATQSFMPRIHDASRSKRN